MVIEGELWRASAGELATAIRTRQISARETIEAHLDRITAVNPQLNAVTVVHSEDALAAAALADEATIKGDGLGPLHGVPFTVKENIDVTGSSTTQGVTSLAEAVASCDAPVVERLRAAGAIVIGRTNMPDFGMRWQTESSLRGITRNPWDPERTPGGSSGGEAVALATGMTPLGLGNDYGGSLRYPSQCCGTTALKPSFGRIGIVPGSESPDPLPGNQLFSVTGPMARRIDDLRLCLEILSTPELRDPRWTPVPLDGPLDATLPRVAIVINPGGIDADPQVAAGVRLAADTLTDAGFHVEECAPPHIREAADIWAQITDGELRSELSSQIFQHCSKDVLRFIQLTTGTAPEQDLGSYLQAHTERFNHAREWSAFFEHYPLILGPVSTASPFTVGYDIEGTKQALGVRHSMHLTVIANLLGLPAVALPVGLAEGLPQGVQLIARPYREDLCISAAQAIEDRVGIITPIDLN
jgi:amidase